MQEKQDAKDSVCAAITSKRDFQEFLNPEGVYHIRCEDPEGNTKWTDIVYNLVTTGGKNKILDAILGNTAMGSVVMGLKGQGTAVAADLQASHVGWVEVGGASSPTYSGTRATPAFGAASAGSKSCTTVSFSITSAGTVAGCFINVGGLSTIDNTTGTLLSAGDFTGGAKTVANGDTLNVTYSLAV